MILYILLCGYPPFNGPTDELIIQKVKSGKFTTDEEEWSKISPDAKDLVKKLLTFNPQKRIDAKGAL